MDLNEKGLPEKVTKFSAICDAIVKCKITTKRRNFSYVWWQFVDKIQPPAAKLKKIHCVLMEKKNPEKFIFKKFTPLLLLVLFEREKNVKTIDLAN